MPEPRELTGESLATINETLAHIKSKLDRIDYAIRGNGDPGLNERVRLLERGQRQISRIAWGVGATAGGFILIQIVAFVVGGGFT